MLTFFLVIEVNGGMDGGSGGGGDDGGSREDAATATLELQEFPWLRGNRVRSRKVNFRLQELLFMISPETTDGTGRGHT